jgi:hypothetical protein
MAFTADTLTVTTTPQLVVSASHRTTLRLRPGSTVYIGANNSVSSSNGYVPSFGSDLFQIELRAGDEIWAVRASGTTDLSYTVQS